MGGKPENDFRTQIIARDVQKPENIQFDFQGSQNLYIKVAYLRRPTKYDFNFPPELQSS